MADKEWLKMLEYQQELHHFSRMVLLQEEKHTLTISEIEILSWLSIHPGKSTPLDLARETGMKKEAVSRCLKKLTEKDCIEKTQHPEDKRSFILTVSETGNKELKDNYAFILKTMYALKREMGSSFETLFEEIQRANRFIDKIKESRDNIDEIL